MRPSLQRSPFVVWISVDSDVLDNEGFDEVWCHFHIANIPLDDAKRILDFRSIGFDKSHTTNKQAVDFVDGLERDFVRFAIHPNNIRL